MAILICCLIAVAFLYALWTVSSILFDLLITPKTSYSLQDEQEAHNAVSSLCNELDIYLESDQDATKF